MYTTVAVKSKDLGTYTAIKKEGKAPYTQCMAECKPVILKPSDTVVDIGAFVGEYAMRAARSGVKCVRAYEPTPFSFDILEKNLEAYSNAHPVRAAVVGDDRKFVDLYISKGNGTRNKLGVMKGSPLTIPAVNYVKAIKGATVVKLDVEGAEWDYPITENLDKLRAIIIEFHPKTEVHKAQTKEICDKIEQAGFKMVFPKTDEEFWTRYDKHGKRWSAHRAWVRDETEGG